MFQSVKFAAYRNPSASPASHRTAVQPCRPSAMCLPEALRHRAYKRPFPPPQSRGTTAGIFPAFQMYHPSKSAGGCRLRGHSTPRSTQGRALRRAGCAGLSARRWPRFLPLHPARIQKAAPHASVQGSSPQAVPRPRCAHNPIAPAHPPPCEAPLPHIAHRKA